METVWFVGAMWGERDDQFQRFIKEGVWQNGYKDRHLDMVKSMKPGERIAIKAAYTRRKELLFDNHGKVVSVMSIKATGTITSNDGDGRTVHVTWDQVQKPREWYFFTNRGTIWKVDADGWMRQALIDFAFSGQSQPLDKFLDDPYWKARYGPTKDFEWTIFYEELATKLLGFRHNRTALLQGLYQRVSGTDYLRDQYKDGSSGPMIDICPFTLFGIFNRGITNDNRIRIAAELKTFLNIQAEVPTNFDGIPVVHNTASWFFSFEKERQPDDIERLWAVFDAGIKSADLDDESLKEDFEQSYDQAMKVRGVAWNLTMGLYWIRPWHFPTLDRNTRGYLQDELSIKTGPNPPNAKSYFEVTNRLLDYFNSGTAKIRSFPDLSRAAWLRKPEPLPESAAIPPAAEIPQPLTAKLPPYALNDIINEGCFQQVHELEAIQARLKDKLNLILQGPPGTGKTWLARRLAFALIGKKDSSRIKALQFHPNLSYEDFVRGYRPDEGSTLTLKDGPFMEAVALASSTPDQPFVVIIEEINRGNPAQIFGELLTLLERDKRNEQEALELCYGSDKVHLPPNLYLIGTMNVADKSLAMVDFALRRRFAFVDLEPRVDEQWKAWVTEHHKFDQATVDHIARRINELNDTIATDTTLGAAFRIGHSFVTPPLGQSVDDPAAWFDRVIDTEIAPLLDEYWFDAAHKALEAKKCLRSKSP